MDGVGRRWVYEPNGPQSLRTTVSTLLASNFPIHSPGGPTMCKIYKRRIWPIAREASSFDGAGFSECWASRLAPSSVRRLERAPLGRNSFLKIQTVFLDRNGYLEGRSDLFTFSCSPSAIVNRRPTWADCLPDVTETNKTRLHQANVARAR